MEPTGLAGRTVVVLDPLGHRPDRPDYDRLLTVLTGCVHRTVTDLGGTATVLAADRVGTDEVLARCRAADLIVIAGGEDVSPALYGGATGYPDAGVHVPAADIQHVRVIRDAIASQTPLLGICRGLQLINVACGGTLIQHLAGHTCTTGDEAPFTLTRLRPVPGTPPPPGADLDAPVRCTHHQAVGDLGAGLEVTVRAGDGVVEAVRHTAAPVIGVQWHPEHPADAAEQLSGLLLGTIGLAGVRRSERAAGLTV
jgi:putative glutamine amidotransferase